MTGDLNVAAAGTQFAHHDATQQTVPFQTEVGVRRRQRRKSCGRTAVDDRRDLTLDRRADREQEILFAALNDPVNVDVFGIDNNGVGLQGDIARHSGEDTDRRCGVVSCDTVPHSAEFQLTVGITIDMVRALSVQIDHNRSAGSDRLQPGFDRSLN